jgi:DNA polymerase-1
MSDGAPAPAIPAEINEFDRLAAARFYADTLRWAVHPLHAPDKGDEKTRGKKPLLRGWPNHRAADISPDFLEGYFGNGTNHNIGCVVRAPFIHIDLDSKRDCGKSVEEWMANIPALANAPRERTAGGVHLVFICRDLPEEILAAKKAPTVTINEAVSAELYKDGLNIVLSPSVHPSGHRYTWEVTGPIPEVRWAEIARWFGFETPEPKRRGRQPKEKPWWAKWREDLRTLNLVKVMRELGRLGECADPDAAKWSVRCPWESEHSGDKEGAGTDTVIFNKPETLPAFRCLHSHCDSRTIGELLEWADTQTPGIVSENCGQLRVWEPGSKNREGRPRIVLPSTGRAHSEFAQELGTLVAPSLDLFRFARNVVEITVVPAASADGAIPGNMLATIKAAGLVTAVERSVETGIVEQDDSGERIFLPKSMSEQDARITLVSEQFLGVLPRIDRVLDVAVPTLNKGGELVYPKRGYDERFGTWLNPAAPEIRTMGLQEALDILLGDLFNTPENGGFWWHDEQARTHAIARFITPMCRGLMRWRRAPLFVFDGNREGCGKDTCADVVHIVYTGRSIICAPLSKDCDDEMRKRITSALMAASRFFHLANMKGHVRYASLEAATDDSGVWEDRKLGVSETLRLPNETEFSFSANNATWEPDIERRCRRVRLQFRPDNVNGHRYRHADLRGWLLQHRADLLSAVAAMIAHWVRSGCPAGPSPFTSFPEWGRVVGGVMHAGGLPDPCLPHEDSNSSGDQNTRAMRQFFALAFDRFGDRDVLKTEFQQFIQQDEDVHDLFDWIDFDTRRGLITFGKLLIKFDGRELGAITFRIRRTSKNRADYRFYRPGDAGDLPLNPESDSSKRGCGGVGGCSYHADIAREKISDDERKRNELKGAYIGVGRTSPNITTSPLPVIHTTRKGLDAIAADLSGADTIALDIETYGPRKGDGLYPWRGDIRLLTLQRSGGDIHIIDLRPTGYDLGPLASLLPSKLVIGHNIKFDALWLLAKCGLRLPRVFCTLTAARLLVAGTKPGNNLDQCLHRYCGIEPSADKSTSDWGAMLLTEDQIAYAARDVAHLHALKGRLDHELEMNGLDGVAQLEMQLLPIVIDMEHAGFAVNRLELQDIEHNCRIRASDIAAQLRRLLDSPLNLGSPAQLLVALQSKGLELENTNEETLQNCGEKTIVPLILEYRGIEKQAQQAASLIDCIAGDGRIHGQFEPTGTATGRFSSKNPNLQNIGRGDLRNCFVAPDGRTLIVADYSQVELRAAAAIAGETRMIDAYSRGDDLHRATAAAVLGKDASAVTKEDRQLAKAVNFGLLYGQSHKGLVRYAATSYGVTMSEEEADSIRRTFFNTYGHLRQWHGESHVQAEKGVEEIRTATGRRRLIPATASEWERFTALVNTPVQGGCADGMKQAIVLLASRLPQGAQIISTVHDELIVEAEEGVAAAVKEILESTMREAMANLFPQVPIEVEAKVCRSWGEK